IRFPRPDEGAKWPYTDRVQGPVDPPPEGRIRAVLFQTPRHKSYQHPPTLIVRLFPLLTWLPGADQPVDRYDSGPAREDRRRHGDHRQVHLVAMPLAWLERPVEKDTVGPMHLGDRHHHDDNQATAAGRTRNPTIMANPPRSSVRAASTVSGAAIPSDCLK